MATLKGIPRRGHEDYALLPTKTGVRRYFRIRPKDKTENRNSEVATAVHTLTEKELQYIPYTAKQVARMEELALKKMYEFEKTLESDKLFIEQKEERLGESLSYIRDTKEAINRHHRAIRRGSRADQEAYFDAQKKLPDLEKIYKLAKNEHDLQQEELNLHKERLKKKRVEFRRELMEDNTVRYVEEWEGRIYRQHINREGDTDGMVEDGIEVHPDAIIDIRSTVGGKGLVIGPDAKLQNAYLYFAYGDANKNNRSTPMPDTVTINERLTDCEVIWKLREDPATKGVVAERETTTLTPDPKWYLGYSRKTVKSPELNARVSERGFSQNQMNRRVAAIQQQRFAEKRY